MRLLLLPLDNRPVTCILPHQVARIAGLQTTSPPRSFLGSLSQPASPGQLINWIENTLSEKTFDSLLLCLDSILYGGLTNSRRCTDSLPDILARAAHLNLWKKLAHSVIFAQSSIMRISDNYDAGAEKAYWSQFGREIFAWSQCLHKLEEGLPADDFATIENKLPQEIKTDYLHSRQRNFQAQCYLLDCVVSGYIDRLVFSLDDSGQYGLNKLEEKRLMNLASQLSVNSNVEAYAGADEVLCTLIAKYLTSVAGRSPKAHVEFSISAAQNCPSRYEGQSIGTTVQTQLHAAGIAVSSSEPDFCVIVHANANVQGDHIKLAGLPDLTKIDTEQAVENTLKLLEQASQPCILCDVAYANGSDPLLMEKLLTRRDLVNKLWGYAGWNTTGNTVGTALAMGIARWFASKHANSQEMSAAALKQSLFVRFADDWAYQSNVRGISKGNTDLEVLGKSMQPLFKKIEQALDWRPEHLSINLPWNRAFEIEIIVQ